MRYIYLVLAVLQTVLTYAQDQTVRGRVVDEQQHPIEGVTIQVVDHKVKTETDAQGKFTLRLAAGPYQLRFSHINCFPQKLHIQVDQQSHIKVVLKSKESESLDEIRVVGKTGIKKIKETAYNVTVLDAKPTYNTSLEVTSLLNKAAGVKIRQEAGLGSSYNISLNGFTGRAVKVFMDGVPMEGFGSAYNLNNIPTTMLEHIQIFKGVAPIEFGADAMGGVINIVTRPVKGSSVDASYSYGSFNTHKTNINVAYVARNGFTVDLRAIQNYSDNSYRTYSKSLDLGVETFSEDKHWFKRFNDTYHNESLVAKVGFIDKPWADQFFIGATVGKVYKEIQNAYQQQIVYGMKHQTGDTFMPNLVYAKRNLFTENLDFRVNANYNRNFNENIDTAARTYNWIGEHKKKRYIGEGAPALGKFYNRNGSVTANLKYRFAEQHAIALNNNFTTFTRKSKNDLIPVDELTVRDTMRSLTSKNTLGFAYQFDSKKYWNATAFYKLYMQHVIAPVDTSTNPMRITYAEKTRNTANSGFGVAGTYFWRDLQFKLSMERAFRLLSSNELFGDENLETANTKLRPEKSNNLNVNIAYNKNINKVHDFYVEGGFIYRYTYDYIRQEVEERFGTISSRNHGKVLSLGTDIEARYAYKNRLLVGGAFSYLKTINEQRYVSSISTMESIIYKDQLPNIPYLFGNMDVQYVFPKLLGKSNILTVGYSGNYIHEFYLGWASQGSEKYTLPSQLSHDAFVSAALKNGRYNISLQARNLTDELLYDNFELQKPGRNFTVKLRYFFNKSNN